MSERNPTLRIDIEANIARQSFTVHHEVGANGTNGEIWQLVDLLRKLADTIDIMTGRPEMLRRKQELQNRLDSNPFTRGTKI